jgi:hypothetical protein
MVGIPFKAAHISHIPTPIEPEPGSYEWKPVRRHFDVRSFGVNVSIAPESGDWVIGEHTETDTRHEELFFVAHGHATFVVDGTEVDAPSGTFVFVPDPASSRGARALEAGTIVLAMGGEPGAPYSVSSWEQKFFE